MHMADALISPAVGGAMWAASAGLTVYSARKLKEEMDERKVPLMGVMGALIFAAQMINFTIPGTGSSGHLGGGLLLAVLLGPHAAFLTMASILTIQALFFADGGLLALGCNIFNMGFFSCFVAFPLVYKRITASGGRKPMLSAALVASIVALQLGALGVVTETVFSGISELTFGTFILLMLPIHLAIGIVEGFVTASLVGFVRRTRPEVLETELFRSAPGDSAGPGGIVRQIEPRSHRGRGDFASPRPGSRSYRPVLIALILIAAFTGGMLSWFSSANPDGLEWSIARSRGDRVLQSSEGRIHALLSEVQKKIAFLPDYNFRKGAPEESATGEGTKGKEDVWPSVSAGTSISGLLGGAMSLALVGLIGFGIKILQKKGRRTDKGSGITDR
ncbi:MAG TPA: energy-coupling factor ABC transporter permease [Syntrophobacteraceae bacterium]|nr:energy-coupling factor ABC transporter permease [Syntrophobacteraceae bacterium]